VSTRTRKKLGYSTLALAFGAFIVAVVVMNTWLRGARLDLTENNLYTLGAGTRAVLREIDEPINLYFFFSDEATEGLPQVRAFATRVREMLEEFEAAAPDGKLVLNVIDPQPFSEEEDRAEQLGIQGANIGPNTDPLYLGLAGTNSVGMTERIPIFDPSDPRKEAMLEYDLARLVYKLAVTEKPVVALLTSAPVSGGFNPQTQQPSPAWVSVEQAQQLLEVRTLSSPVLTIDDDVDVLWLVHPQNLDESTLYAIDQFVMRGGRALIFVDPNAEVLGGADPTGLGIPSGSSSTLEPLFTAWGVTFDDTRVVADNRYALSIGSRFQTTRHIGLLGLDAEAMSQDDPITTGLNLVNLGLAGHFELAEGATATLTPLLRSSVEAQVMPADRFQFLPDPEELLNGFLPDGKQYVLAARLGGSLKSAFPNGAPTNEDRQAPVDAALGAAHLASTDNANLVLVADVDMLSDRLWVQAQNFLGQRLLTAFANNGDFVVNALDNLSGSAALIGLRSRATYTRPFTRVEELQRRADLEFRATEDRLEAELTQTEQRLGELQAARSDGGGSLLMSPEQQAEIQRFLDEQVRIRQELRTVRRNLDADIERLGIWIKAINIVLVPLLLIIAALAVVVVRRRKRNA
jgi:ABC-type uncharacterized transport system involved in gliding motility auxiliary subunit